MAADDEVRVLRVGGGEGAKGEGVLLQMGGVCELIFNCGHFGCISELVLLIGVFNLSRHELWRM